MKRSTEAECDQQVIANALRLYEDALDAHLNGHDVLIRYRDGTERNVFEDADESVH